MKTKLPTWAVITSVAVVLVLFCGFMWYRTNQQYSEKVVPVDYDMSSRTGGKAPAAVDVPNEKM